MLTGVRKIIIYFKKHILKLSSNYDFPNYKFEDEQLTHCFSMMTVQTFSTVNVFKLNKKKTKEKKANIIKNKERLVTVK